jgi:phage terminase large subunit-like protein
MAANAFVMTPKERADNARALALLQEQKNRKAQRLFFEIYPANDTVWDGPTILGGLMKPGQIIHSRDKYAKHLEWLDAGREYRERCAMMANRVGKTFSLGGYELAAHLTGLYPDWWTGRRFDHPVSTWAAGDTYLSTRDIIQLTLLGEVTYRDGRKVMDGRGIVPGHLIGRNTWHNGVQDLIDTIVIRHVTGGSSFLGLKSYDQGRKAFQGTGRHVIWFDEEPPEDVYGEALIRTATVGGLTMLTFTPLSGLSEVVLSFLPADQRPLDEDAMRVELDA